MNPYNLSNNELQIVSYIKEDHNIALVSHMDMEQVIHFSSGLLMHLLKEGKSVIIRTKRDQSFHRLLSILEINKIAHRSYLPGQDLYEKFEERNQIEEKNTALFLEILKSNLAYKSKLADINRSLEKLKEPVFGEFSRIKIAELLYLSKVKCQDYDLNLELNYQTYQFNKKEFWYLRGRVEKAAQHYDPTFSFLKSSDEFADSIYKDFHITQNQEIVFRYLEKFISDTKVIYEAFKRLFLSIHERLRATFQERIFRIEELVKELNLEIDYYALEFEFSTPRKAFTRNKDPLEDQKQRVRAKYNELLEYLDEVQLFKVKAPINSWNPDITELRNFTEGITKTLVNSFHIVKSKVDGQLEVLNSSNFDAPELSKYLKEQEELIYAINGSNLFKKEFQNLSISAWKNYEFIKTLYAFLKKNLKFLKKNLPYAVWRSYEYSLEPKALFLVEALQNKPTQNWESIFELWYFGTLYAKYPLSGPEDMGSTFQLMEEIKYIDKSYDAIRIEHLSDIKYFETTPEAVKNWEKFKSSILNNSSSMEDWRNIIAENKTVFPVEFPVLIIDENVPSGALVHLPYDYLINYDEVEISAELIGNTHFEGILYFHQSTIEKTILERLVAGKNYKGKKSFELSNYMFSNSKEHAKMLKDQLLKGKALSAILKLITYEKRFYSAKSFSIITCLSPFCTRLFEIEIEGFPLKKLNYHHIESGIVEDILIKEDNYKILMVQEGFLDLDLDVEWQIMALNMIERFGIKIVPVNTFALARGNNETILSFIDIPGFQETIGEQKKPLLS